MNYFKWIFFVFLTFLIQTQISIFHHPLNLTVVLVYIFGLKSLALQPAARARGHFGSTVEIKSISFGAGIGILEDIISGAIIGPGFFSKGIIGFISVTAFKNLIFKWTPLVGGIALVILTIFDATIFTGMRVLFTGININGFIVLQAIFIQAIFNIPFGIIFKAR